MSVQIPSRRRSVKSKLMRSIDDDDDIDEYSLEETPDIVVVAADASDSIVLHDDHHHHKRRFSSRDLLKLGKVEKQQQPNLNDDADEEQKQDDDFDSKSLSKWTVEQDQALRKCVKKHGARNWKMISNSLSEMNIYRNEVQCMHRWTKVLRPGLVKGAWTPEDDRTLIEAVEEEGIANIKWSTVASKLPGRIGKQCRERWFNHLDPTVKKTSWTQSEDDILFRAQQRIGNHWCKIAELLPGRSENTVKNRWNSSARKRWYEAHNLVYTGKPRKTQTRKNSKTKASSPKSHVKGSSKTTTSHRHANLRAKRNTESETNTQTKQEPITTLPYSNYTDVYGSYTDFFNPGIPLSVGLENQTSSKHQFTNETNKFDSSNQAFSSMTSVVPTSTLLPYPSSVFSNIQQNFASSEGIGYDVRDSPGFPNPGSAPNTMYHVGHVHEMSNMLDSMNVECMHSESGAQVAQQGTNMSDRKDPGDSSSNRSNELQTYDDLMINCNFTGTQKGNITDISSERLCSPSLFDKCNDSIPDADTQKFPLQGMRSVDNNNIKIEGGRSNYIKPDKPSDNRFGRSLKSEPESVGNHNQLVDPCDNPDYEPTPFSRIEIEDIDSLSMYQDSLARGTTNNTDNNSTELLETQQTNTEKTRLKPDRRFSELSLPLDLLEEALANSGESSDETTST